MRELLLTALVVGLVGIVLVTLSMRVRKRRGFAGGPTIALDNVTLFSQRLKLVGRPDRIVREGKAYIPEEWKSSKRVTQGHRLQLATYFLLIEDVRGTRPPYGWVVLRDGTRVQVKNTEALRSEVLRIAGLIREQRANLVEAIPVNQPVWKCRVCGQRGNCDQRD